MQSTGQIIGVENDGRALKDKRHDRHRLRWVDSLRAVAVISVVLQHRLPADTFHRLGAVEKYVDLGIFGVTVFFLISGYIIPFSVLRLGNQPEKRFPIARFFRLYPAYWLSVLSTVVMRHPSPRAVVTNLSMMQRFVGVSDLIGVYWTLQVELIFYAVIQLIIIRRQVKSGRVYMILSILSAFIAVCAAAGRFYLHRKVPLAPMCGLSLMFAGTVFFMHTSFSYLSRSAFLMFSSAIFLLLGLSCLLGYSHDWGYNETPHRFIAMYLLGTLTFLVFFTAKINTAALNFIGKISYSIYLLHEPIMGALGWKGSSAIGYILSVALIVLASAATYYALEKPLIDFGRTFANFVCKLGAERSETGEQSAKFST